MSETNNLKLWEKELGLVKGFRVESDTLTLEVDGQDDITIQYHHDQDCCEHVYADFGNVPYHQEKITGKNIEKLEIKGVSDIGFLLCFSSDDWDYDRVYEKILVPCYNEQNGYYSSNLELVIKQGKTTTKLDIYNYIEDHIS